MDTKGIDLMGRRRRRRHSAEFKAMVVGECRRPGVSMAAVALTHGLNANLLRRWVIDAERTGVASTVEPEPHAPAPAPPPTFIPLALPAAPSDADIRIDAVWLRTVPMDMRAGADTALARVVAVFGAAQPHHAYVFANKRSSRLKVLVHDGIGIWLAARRLHEGRFVMAGGAAPCSITREQLDALVTWSALAARGCRRRDHARVATVRTTRVHCRMCRWRVH